MKRFLKISLLVVACLAIAAYTAYAALFMSVADEEQKCDRLEITLTNNPKVHFVSDEEIKNMLMDAQAYPEGRLMKDVSCKLIETTIAKNPFVESIECYKSQDGSVHVDIEQRTPVVYILPDNRSGYFVDNKGKVIPNTYYVDNIVTATGHISEEFAKKELTDIGNYLQVDEFWNSQIAQIYVSVGKNGKHIIDIVPRVGNHIVHLGTVDDYQKKLHRLRTFYEQGLTTVGWNKYSYIDLQFDNQIICKKHKAKG